MFLRPCYRLKNGKKHAYWMLVESYRTERGPRQRVVAYLGQMDPAGRLGIQEAAEGTPRSRQNLLFESSEPHWVEVDAISSAGTVRFFDVSNAVCLLHLRE